MYLSRIAGDTAVGRHGPSTQGMILAELEDAILPGQLNPIEDCLSGKGYKSILWREDIYLLEPVRCIHLNPLRAPW